MKKETHKYYKRIIEISYSIFDDWLNLPRGFKIDAIEMVEKRNTLTLRVSCPPKPEYLVRETEIIPTAIPVIHNNKFGFVTKIWHPELGQTEPSDRRKRIKKHPYGRIGEVKID